MPGFPTIFPPCLAPPRRLDKVVEQTMIPELAVGDWLVPHMGAYTALRGRSLTASTALAQKFYVCFSDADPDVNVKR